MRKLLVGLSVLVLAAACGEDTTNTPPKFNLTISKIGTGTGTVSGGGISCGATCSASFDSGASVTLTATADPGSQFVSWSDCAGAQGNVCTLTMSASRTVTVQFNFAQTVVVSSDITTATTWSMGSIYQVTKAINVKAPLIIQPGVEVRFDAGASLRVTSTITADGQPSGAALPSPVVFTSSKGSPAGGDWGGITLAANGSLFNRCMVLYAGAAESAALAINAGFSATVTNCTFAHHRTPTDAIDATPALDASEAAAGTVIKDNLFFDNRAPLAQSTKFAVQANLFDNSAAAPTNPQPNKYNALFIPGCAHVTTTLAWPVLPVPYVIGNPRDACNYLTIDSGAQLTVGSSTAAATVKFFKGGSLGASGVLTGRAIFTSIRDDAHGGDTNGDGASSGTAADWAGVQVSHNGASLDHSSFLYAGDGDHSALSVGSNIAVAVTNSVFAHHRPATDTVQASPALDASDAAAATVITGNTFFDTTVPLAINTTYSLDDSNLFTGSDTGGAATGNKFQAVIVRGCGQVAAAITWSQVKVPMLIGDPSTACNYLTVASGGHLTLADNVIVKFFPSGSLGISGVLTANATTGIVFTSYRDDAHGGDTNADAAGSAAAGGDWQGIRASSSGSVFNKVSFLYGGGAGSGDSASALSLASAKSMTVTNSIFAHTRPSLDTLTAPPALDLSDGAAAGTVVTGNTFFDNAIPLGINATQSLDDSNVFTVASTTNNRYNGIIVAGCGQVTSATQWLVSKVPLVIGDAVTACNYLNVQGGGHLTLGPGVVLKFFQEGSIGVASSGLLTVDATAWLTCISDDHLTDTNGDGGATWPSVGDWRGIKYAHSGANPTCDESAYMHWHTPNNPDHSCSW